MKSFISIHIIVGFAAKNFYRFFKRMEFLRFSMIFKPREIAQRTDWSASVPLALSAKARKIVAPPTGRL
jgi:hypothetical protein